MIVPECVIDMTGSSTSMGIIQWTVESVVPSEGIVNTHELWGELHSEPAPTQGWFEGWVSRVPNISCGCRKWVREYIETNPPDFGTGWRVWTWTFHNAVNAKLGKPEFTWDKFKAKYSHWLQVDGLRIGFAVAGYESIGGTETFHQTLVPRLPGVIGFASQNEIHGDVSKLGVPARQGVDAIASLAEQCDTIISWNIDWDSLEQRPSRVIAVHHGCVDDTWGTRFALQGDVIVAVGARTAKLLRTMTTKPVHCIEPAVDPNRLKPLNTVETHGKKICLWAHRVSTDKRPQLPSEPTDAPCGSLSKIQVMAERDRLGQSLWHPCDSQSAATGEEHMARKKYFSRLG